MIPFFEVLIILTIGGVLSEIDTLIAATEPDATNAVAEL